MQTSIRFKACPKCRGDLSLERDIYGQYWGCQQCGQHYQVKVPAGRPQELTA